MFHRLQAAPRRPPPLQPGSAPIWSTRSGSRARTLYQPMPADTVRQGLDGTAEPQLSRCRGMRAVVAAAARHTSVPTCSAPVVWQGAHNDCTHPVYDYLNELSPNECKGTLAEANNSAVVTTRAGSAGHSATAAAARQWRHQRHVQGALSQSRKSLVHTPSGPLETHGTHGENQGSGC